MRDDFTRRTKETLAKRVGYKCSNPNCKKLTSGPNEDENKSTSIGVAAHITGASKGGPRFNEEMNVEERKGINNGIWLCQNCSVLIDKDESKYSIELLESWKVTSEDKAKEEISTSNKNQLPTNNSFQTLFFELLNQQEIVLKDLEVTKRKTQDGKILSEEKIIGRKAIKSYFEIFRDPFKKYQSWDSQLPKEDIPKECSKFFSDAPELVKYFNLNKQLLRLLKSKSNLENIELYINIFLSKVDYYEKIMLFYYIYESKDENYLDLAKEFEILEGIKKEDLIHGETFGLI
ncbi:MAG: hypothetical protein IPL46_29915 [Saprospiraceae bacterium]|nr:hypothetical protein [Saprospiraceae bacterium]